MTKLKPILSLAETKVFSGKSKFVLLAVGFIDGCFCFLSVFPQAVATEREQKQKAIKPNASDPEEMETVTVAPHVKMVRKKDKTNKKMDKATKKADHRGGKTGKDAKISEKKPEKRPLPYPKKEEAPKPTRKPAAPARGSLPLFLDHFENKRRLLVRVALLMRSQ